MFDENIKVVVEIFANAAQKCGHIHIILELKFFTE